MSRDFQQETREIIYYRGDYSHWAASSRTTGAHYAYSGHADGLACIFWTLAVSGESFVRPRDEKYVSGTNILAGAYWLEKGVSFSRGRLYVGLSRVGSPDNHQYVLLPENNTTSNIRRTQGSFGVKYKLLYSLWCLSKTNITTTRANSYTYNYEQSPLSPWYEKMCNVMINVLTIKMTSKS